MLGIVRNRASLLSTAGSSPASLLQARAAALSRAASGGRNFSQSQAIGLDMSRFPTAGHLVSWAKLSPRTIQSGASSRSGRTGKGNAYLKGVLGEAAAAAARTDTFIGERYRRIVKCRGKLKALVTAPLHPDHHLEPPRRPRRPLPRPRRWLSRQPHRHGQEGMQPCPAAGGTRVHRRTYPGSLTCTLPAFTGEGSLPPARLRWVGIIRLGWFTKI